MKQHLLTLCFVVLSLFTSLNMFGATTSSDAIDLKGRFPKPKTRSADKPLPFEASINGSTLIIDFLSMVENVTVNLYNLQGDLVYQFSIQIATPQQTTISMDNYPRGSYTIDFSYSDGESVYGNFNL